MNMEDGMKRSIKKQIWLSRDEAEMLKKKAKKVVLCQDLVQVKMRNFSPF